MISMSNIAKVGIGIVIGLGSIVALKPGVFSEACIEAEKKISEGFEIFKRDLVPVEPAAFADYNKSGMVCEIDDGLTIIRTNIVGWKRTELSLNLVYNAQTESGEVILMQDIIPAGDPLYCKSVKPYVKGE